MSVTPPPPLDYATGRLPRARKPFRLGMLSLLFLGEVTALGGCVASQGNGASPLVYGLLGIFSAVFARFAARPARPKWVPRAAVFFLTFCASFAIAHFTSRVSPTATFTRIFGIAPPPTISALAARCQWYDGRVRYLSFTADAATYAALVSRPGMAVDSTESATTTAESLYLWDGNFRTWSAMSYDLWPRPTTTVTAESSHISLASTTFFVFRDTTTGQTFVVRLED